MKKPHTPVSRDRKPKGTRKKPPTPVSKDRKPKGLAKPHTPVSRDRPSHKAKVARKRKSMAANNALRDSKPRPNPTPGKPPVSRSGARRAQARRSARSAAIRRRRGR